MKYLSYFSQKTGSDISCKLSLMFYGKNKETITNLSSAELAKRVVKVNGIQNHTRVFSVLLLLLLLGIEIQILACAGCWKILDFSMFAKDKDALLFFVHCKQ